MTAKSNYIITVHHGGMAFIAGGAMNYDTAIEMYRGVRGKYFTMKINNKRCPVPTVKLWAVSEEETWIPEWEADEGGQGATK